MSNKEERHKLQLTTHLSSDAANVPELETSRVNPFRLSKISWSFSKLVLGGGKCRLGRKC